MDLPPAPIPESLGRYVVQKEIGRGAMGCVFLAQDPLIGRPVAIKLIQTSIQLEAKELPKYRERFYREAQAAGKLLHPGIVAVFDVGHTEEGVPYIVLEYVEGQTLKEMIEADNLPLAETLRMTEEILDALGYAHSQGIVHRDIKPGNILVTREGHAKIMDFGIAHLEGSEYTKAGELLGTPNYMSPEQIEGKTVDHRCDLFSIGVLLYLMITGCRPFEGESLTAISYAIVNKDPIPPEQINSEIPAALSRIVLRCLGKDPAQRYTGAEEIKKEIRSIHVSIGETVTQEALQEEVEELVDVVETMPLERTFSAKGYPRLLGIAAAAVVLLVPLLFFLFPRSKDENLLKEAEKAYEKGELEESKAKLGELLSKQPNSRKALELLSKVADHQLLSEAEKSFEAHRLEESKAKLEELLNRNPEFPAAQELVKKVEQEELFLGAKNAFSEHDFYGSRAKLEELMKMNPRFPDASALMERTVQEILFLEAKTTLESDKFSESRSKLEELLRRNSHFPGASELLESVVEEELFAEAKKLFGIGTLDQSRSKLESLLAKNPGFTGASELLKQVVDEMKWKEKTLPLSFAAKHKHRLGDCRGTLTLYAWGVQYISKEHSWKWQFKQIRMIDNSDPQHFVIETFEKEVLKLGDYKNFSFTLLGQGLSDENRTKYRRLWNGAR